MCRLRFRSMPLARLVEEAKWQIAVSSISPGISTLFLMQPFRYAHVEEKIVWLLLVLKTSSTQ